MEKSKSMADPKNTATISLGDFMRIRNTIIPSISEEEEKKKKDTVLKELSNQKSKQWPDSLEMAKKNKMEQRKKNFIEKELEKRKIDEEERKYQEAQKKIINERANKLFFDSQDQVKAFHSKLLLSDTLKEREFQQEIKKRKTEMNQQVEKQWEELEKQKMIDYDRREQEKIDQDRKKKGQQMEYINQQFKDYKIKRIKEYQDRVVEGEIIKLQAQQELEKERQKEQQTREKHEKMKEEFKKANAELEMQKEEIKLKEKEMLRKIEEYSVKKQQVTDTRKRREEEKFKENQRQRQILIDKQVEYLNNLKNKEDERISNQVREVEEKKAIALAEKRKRFDDLKKQIDDSRDIQLKRKKMLHDQDKKDEKEFVEFWKEKMKLLEEQENIEKEEIKERNLNLQNFLKLQMSQKKGKAEEEFYKNQENAYKTKAILEKEQQDFLNYAESWINEYHGTGKDIKPLMLELKEQKKKSVFG